MIFFQDKNKFQVSNFKFSNFSLSLCRTKEYNAQCNDYNFNDFNDSANSKVFSEGNDSHIKKTEIGIKENFDEIAINQFKGAVPTQYHIPS